MAARKMHRQLQIRYTFCVFLPDCVRVMAAGAALPCAAVYRAPTLVGRGGARQALGSGAASPLG